MISQRFTDIVTVDWQALAVAAAEAIWIAAAAAFLVVVLVVPAIRRIGRRP